MGTITDPSWEPGVRRFIDENPGPYAVHDFGRVYRSNGPSYSWKGSISGLIPYYVLCQVKNCREAISIVAANGKRLYHSNRRPS
jgi:hypothetical protein